MEFEWDPVKNEENLRKHGIGFLEAQRDFWDPNRIITLDVLILQISKRDTFALVLLIHMYQL
ncbi:PF04365 domain protein [Leptospira alstonii serovar Pingchang str. 80-412]|uniref:PF04365 domain protein n=2 Tax=Leptospira alstonii TaxID=28452 RepID=M6D8M0_9LEPT|nr:PF04365 domain protein [Leptospira alstonii serovar Sichuan str. 79601]EQA79376.1 PF04365 domain protein [Leptospira alstonii serovar Pingchang str. 80-412]